MKDLTHLEVRDYFTVLWKRRWYFLAVLAMVSAGASIYAFRVPDVYKSETRIIVEEPLVSEDYVRPTVRTTPEDRINSIREQLASRTFLERMIEQNQMYGFGTDPKFVMENAVKAAEKQIGIEKTSNNTFTLSFIATSPQFAQSVTSQLAQELIRLSNSSKKEIVLATDQFIDDQLKQSTDALRAQETKIEQFKTAHLGELPEQANANISALNGLHTQLTATENAIAQAQERQKMLDFKIEERKRLNLISESLAVTENAAQPADRKPSAAQQELAAKKDLLAQYLAKYTPNHPDVVTLKKDIDRLEQVVAAQKTSGASALTPLGPTTAAADQRGKTDGQNDPMEASFKFEGDSIKAEIAKREKEKQDLIQQINAIQTRLKLAPRLDQELSALLREQDVLKSQYEGLQKQKFTTKMATTVETDKKSDTYRIIDPANLPVKAEYPNRLQIVLMGIGGGLVLGIGAAFGREMLDTTIGGEEEAKQVLNLPVLVTIPTVPKAKKKIA
jgi:succinoglycan biosynthesis transport protein ExoP